MLIEFRVANHRSIRDEQALTFEAGRVGDPDDPTPRSVGGLRLLPVLGIYGANASGKSNLLKALLWLQDAVVSSSARWLPDGGVPVEPFAWGPTRAEPSLFEVSFLLEGVRYDYGVAATAERFVEEWLFSYPHGRRRVLLQRDGDDFKFGEHLEGDNATVKAATRPNALFLSTAAQLQHPQLRALSDWFRQVVDGDRHRADPWRLGATLSDYQRRATSDERQDLHGVWSRLLDLVRVADLGIDRIRVDESQARRRFVNSTPVVKEEPWFDIFLRHGDADGAWLTLDQESAGTRRMLELGLVVAVALERGQVVVVDELESSLHPLLARKLVTLFNHPTTNPNNAQLIFSTHDTTLIGTTAHHPALRRDQVWMTDKDRSGASTLFPLTDFQPRKSENMERGYLQGRYGAVPYLGHFVYEKG